MIYVIVDLEATCWKNRDGRQNEIIEIGAVCINDEKRIISEFVQIVKPKITHYYLNFVLN